MDRQSHFFLFWRFFHRRLRNSLGSLRHRILRRLIRLNLSQDVTFLLLGMVVGIASGYGAVVYHEAIRLVQEFLFGTLYGVMKPWQPYIIMILPAIGGLVVGVYLQFFSREVRGY